MKHESPSKFEDAPELMSGKVRSHHCKIKHLSLSNKIPNHVSKCHHRKKSKSQYANALLDPKKLGPPPGKRPRILRLYP